MSTADEPSQIDQVMAQARPAESPAIVLARARVEGALFGDAPGITRFHVLERLGQGGMGVVYAAYDPDLDRGVALKMIHVPAQRRELALAEAKALARLSHPNVVPVFDVGVIEDRVYIVMELVRGKTLADWVIGKTVRAIVGAYQQAGAALAAAHDAGLVHRDFKPDNAIVGNDGRVRVVDFGLACEAESRAGVAGTPRYMAPELGKVPISPAADQYSFSVALDEALQRLGPVPRWVADLVARGRAEDPSDRFASMHELVRSLGRDPSRVWKWRIGAGVVVAALAAAFLVGRGRAVEPDACGGGAAEIAAAWPLEVRSAQLARVGSTSAYGAEVVASVTHTLDAHAARWAAGHRDACMAHRRGEHSAALLDRRMVCLDRSRAALTAVAEITATADAKAFPEIARAALALPDPQACADLATLTSDVDAPPAGAAPRVAVLRGDLERARVLLAAGRANAARDLARAAAAELQAIGYTSLLAEAQLVEGNATMRTDEASAIGLFDRALATSLASHLDAFAVEAWARRAFLMERNSKPEALGGLDVVEALAARTSTATFARALLHNNVGTVELVRGRRDQARRDFEQALRDAAHVTGPGAVELAAIHRNLALVTADAAARDRELVVMRDSLARVLGPTHPDVLVMQYMRATTSVTRASDAAALLGSTCELIAQHESLVGTVASCFAELADLRDGLGDRAGAIAALEHAAASPHADTPELEGYLALWRGDAAAATRELAAALAATPATAADPFRRRYPRGKLELAYGRSLRSLGRSRDARAAFERSLALFDGIDATAPLAVQRRYAQIRAELGATPGSP